MFPGPKGINFTGLSKQATSQTVPFLFNLFGGTPEPPADAAGIKSLIEDKLSFIGVSAYAPMRGAGFEMSELENSAFNVKVRAGRGV